jgi:hypothetical protein
MPPDSASPPPLAPPASRASLDGPPSTAAAPPPVWRLSVRRALWAALWLLAPVAAGILLRLWRLPRQILLFDELHAVRAALALPLGKILTTFQMPDYSIPLTAFYRLLLGAGVRLSEMTLRLPVLLSGFLLLVLAPLAVQRRLGRPAATAFACLLALSPMLVLYGRIVRPYMPITLLGFGAALAFFDWLETGRRTSAAVYAPLAAAAVWFHPGAAPMVLAPLAFAVPFAFRPGALSRRRRWPDSEGIAGLAGMAGSVALLLACLLLPARRSLLLLIAEKHKPQVLPWGDFLHLAPLFAGTAVMPLAALFWLLAVLGLAAIWRTDRRFAAYGAVLVAAQLSGILVLAPKGLQNPQVLARYLVISLPWVLLWVAVGLTWLPRRWSTRRLVGCRLAAAAFFIGALGLLGPLARQTFLHTSFAHHVDFLLFSCEPRTVAAAEVPDFYSQLGQIPDGGGIVEFPWDSYQRLRELYAYEPFHRRPVLVATPESQLDDPRLDLRNLTAPTPEGFLGSTAGFVVVHRDYGSERQRVQIPACAGRPPGMGSPDGDDPELRREARQMNRRLRAEWGPPDYADEAILAWDLDRLRRDRAAISHPSPASAGLTGGAWPLRPQPSSTLTTASTFELRKKHR